MDWLIPWYQKLLRGLPLKGRELMQLVPGSLVVQWYKRHGVVSLLIEQSSFQPFPKATGSRLVVVQNGFERYSLRFQPNDTRLQIKERLARTSDVKRFGR